MWIYAKKSPSPTPEATPTGEPGTGLPGGEDNPVTQVIDIINAIVAWSIAHPIPIAILIAIIAAVYGWSQLRIYMLQRRGVNLPPLSDITGRTLSYMFKEDKQPIIMKPQKLAQRMMWLTGRKQTILGAIAVTALWILGFKGWAILLALVVGVSIYRRIRRVFQYRNSVIMTMYQVANAEFKYGKGSELNARAYVRVTKWNDIYFPDETIIIVPSGYQSEEPRNRERFETNWTGSVTDQHGWTYEWESAKGRVTATPTPKLPTTANHPGITPHDWNTFPLGVTYGGKEALWTVDIAPHLLLTGPTGTGKLLVTSTILPTPNGWTTMGDLQPGDTVFSASGHPTQVTWVSDINPLPDLYRVTFSDGTYIDADAEHLWFTETRAARESEWSASKRVKQGRAAQYRPLLAPEVTSRLRAVASAAGLDGEITIPEVAEIAGVSATAGWLHEVAASVGHVAEVQVFAEFEYAEQTVEQEQMVTRFPAREVWSALAGYTPKIPDWYSQRPACAEKAAAASHGELVSIREVASLLNVTPKFATNLLRTRGLTATQQVDAIGPIKRKVSFFSAREAWTSFAESTCTGEVSWLHLRDKCAELANLSRPEDTVTAREVGDVLGMSRDAALATIKRFKIKGTLGKEAVQLQVGAKTLTRAVRMVKTYSTIALLNAVADYGDRLPHDQRHKKITGQVRTTREILDTLYAPGGQFNHSIPVARPLELPETELPVDPYVLGVWLGDGYSAYGGFCGIDHEIARHFESLGYTTVATRPRDADQRHPDFRIWRSERLQKELPQTGIAYSRTVRRDGSLKKIPAVYLRGSVQQREALLAGLMDTDGTVSKTGAVEFDNTTRALIDGVLELARSLGYRPSVREYRATREGKDYGPAWTVSWTTDTSPFWLSRKTTLHTERNTRYNAQRNQRRYIVSVEPIPAQPGRCISVDDPTRLFLAGAGMIPTHNSVQQRNVLMHALAHPQWRVIGLDPKKVELASLRDPSSPTGLKDGVLRVATTLEDMTEALQQAEDEMNRRYAEMEKIGVNHFTNLPEPLPALLVMIDETFALLSMENIKSDEGKERDAMHARCAALIGSIARLGRASGVHLCLATQRPDAKVLSGELKNNLDARIACGRMDTTPSLMTLDSDAATRLPLIKGRGILRNGGEFMEYQGYFCPPDRFDSYVQQGKEMYDALEADGGMLQPGAAEPDGKGKKKKGKKAKSGGGYGFLPSDTRVFGGDAPSSAAPPGGMSGLSGDPFADDDEDPFGEGLPAASASSAPRPGMFDDDDDYIPPAWESHSPAEPGQGMFDDDDPFDSQPNTHDSDSYSDLYDDDDDGFAPPPVTATETQPTPPRPQVARQPEVPIDEDALWSRYADEDDDWLNGIPGGPSAGAGAAAVPSPQSGVPQPPQNTAARGPVPPQGPPSGPLPPRPPAGGSVPPQGRPNVPPPAPTPPRPVAPKNGPQRLPVAPVTPPTPPVRYPMSSGPGVSPPSVGQPVEPKPVPPRAPATPVQPVPAAPTSGSGRSSGKSMTSSSPRDWETCNACGGKINPVTHECRCSN